MSLAREIGKAALLAVATTLVNKGVEKLFEPPKPPAPPPAPTPPPPAPAKPKRSTRPRVVRRG